MTTYTWATTCDAQTALSTAYDALSPIKGVSLDTHAGGINGVIKRRLQPKFSFSVSASDGRLTLVTDDNNNMAASILLKDFFDATEKIVDDQGWSEVTANYKKMERMAVPRDRVLTIINPDERIKAVTSGNSDGKPVIVVATERFIRIHTGATFGGRSKEISIDQITSVSTSSKLTGDKMKFTVSGSDIEVKSIPQGRGEQFGEVVRALRDEAKAAASTPAPAATGASSTDELVKLAELHAAGVLSDEEFAAAKARALGL